MIKAMQDSPREVWSSLWAAAIDASIAEALRECTIEELVNPDDGAQKKRDEYLRVYLSQSLRKRKE